MIDAILAGRPESAVRQGSRSRDPGALRVAFYTAIDLITVSAAPFVLALCAILMPSDRFAPAVPRAR